MSSTFTESASTAEKAFLEWHQQFLEDEKPSTALLDLNKSAIERFEELKFPSRKHEMYTFCNTKELAAIPFLFQRGNSIPQDFLPDHIYSGCEKSHLTIVDGVLQQNLSDTTAFGSSLKIDTLENALKDKAVEDYFRETTQREDDVFASLNTAFLNSGIVLEVGLKTQLESPLQILFVSTGSDKNSVITTPRVLVKVGSLAEIKVVVKFVGLGENYFVNAVLDWIIGEGGGVTHSQVQSDVANAWHFSKNNISLGANSWFLSANASSGGKLVRHNYEAALKGIGAELRLNGVSVLVNEEQVHNYIRVRHEVPHCTSNQHFKNIINDQGRSSFDGTVIVSPGAQLTNADQLINNLMLSDHGHADNKPNLMIFADDVKCTHGATVGQISEEQLFYLKTRGLSEEVAKEMLTRSFAESIVQTISFPAVVEDLNKTLLKKLEAKHA